MLASHKKTDLLQHRAADMVTVYTALISELIDLTAAEARQTSDPRTGSILRGYVTLSKIKEITGRERALLTSAFTRGRTETAEYQNLRDFLQARKTLEGVFASLAPDEVVAIFRKTKESAAIAEFLRIENQAVASGAGAASVADAKFWYQAATKHINDLRTAETGIQQQLRNSALAVRSAAQRSLFTDIVFVVAVVFAAALFGVAIAHNITQRMRRTVAEIDGMVNGDLTVRASDAGGDELGILAQAQNRFADKIHDIIKALIEASQSMRNSSAQLSETSSILSSGTEQTSTQSRLIADSAAEMNQKMASLSSAIEEMSISIGEISSHGSQAARMAGDANDAITRSATTIDELGHAADDIGTVTQMISLIADQTKMLALNASIEAAGAGELGKGFSVVASEVKELARQTAESTENIRGKIHAIQDRTHDAVDIVTQIGELVTKLRDVNSSIASTVEEQSMVVKEIASHVGTTVSAAKDVSSNITGISAAAAEGAREAGKSSEQARAMLDLSVKLNAIVSGFRV